MEINLTKCGDPVEEGKYFFISEFFAPELVTVLYYPPKSEYGMNWNGYFGVVEWNGKSVHKHSEDSYFSERIEFIVKD